MAKLSITLKIAGTSYPFPDIDAADEELYRHAEREVNKLFLANAHPALLPKDQLALAALTLAMENVELKMGHSPSEEAQRLAMIEKQINEYLDNTGS